MSKLSRWNLLLAFLYGAAVGIVLEETGALDWVDRQIDRAVVEVARRTKNAR